MRYFESAPYPQIYRWAIVLLFTAVSVVSQASAGPRPQAMDDMPGMQGHSGEDPADGAKLIADKRESEFNHHFAGMLLILAGIFILAKERLAEHWPIARFAWPFCFLSAGLFVLVFSDTEIWPWGNQTPYYALTHNPEDLQHKVFAIILLVLGFVEIQRTRGRLKSVWSALVFPAVSLVGAVLLLFHSHEAGMQGPDPMAVMEHIQGQHKWYASVGFGIVATKGLSEVSPKWRQGLNKAWPILLIVLGMSLALYSE